MFFLAQADTGSFDPVQLEALERFLGSGATQIMLGLLALSILLNFLQIFFSARNINKVIDRANASAQSIQSVIIENNKAQNTQDERALLLAREVFMEVHQRTVAGLDRLSDTIRVSHTSFEEVTADMYTRLEDRQEDNAELYLTIKTYMEREDALKQDLINMLKSGIDRSVDNGDTIRGVITEVQTLIGNSREFWSDELRKAGLEIQRQQAARDLYKSFNGSFTFPPEDDCRWVRRNIHIKNAAKATIWKFPYRLGDAQVGRVTSGELTWIIWDSGFPGWAAIRLNDMPEVYGFLDHTFVSLTKTDEVA